MLQYIAVYCACMKSGFVGTFSFMSNDHIDDNFNLSSPITLQPAGKNRIVSCLHSTVPGRITCKAIKSCENCVLLLSS